MVESGNKRKKIGENPNGQKKLEKRGLKMIKDKTVVMKSEEQKGRGMKVQAEKGEQLKDVSCFKYLATIIYAIEEYLQEVKDRKRAGWMKWRERSVE